MNSIPHFYNRINGNTIDKLGDIINQVHGNSAKKKELRAIEAKFAEFQDAIRNGDHERAGELLTALKTMAKDAGFKSDDPLMTMLNSIDPSGLGDRTTPFSSEEKKVWENFFTDFDRALRLEKDIHSDVTGKTQIELNMYSDLLRKGEKAMSDVSSKWDQAVKGVVANLKA